MRRFILLLYLFVAASSSTNAQPYSQIESQFRKRAGNTTSVSLRDIATGEELIGIRSSEMVIPASVLKLLTTYAALKKLGGEYSFPTELLLSNDKVPILYVRGHGDPVLTEERLWKIADDLYRADIRDISHVVFDDSLFIEPKKRGGLNPYQAAQSALSFNFNSLGIRAELRNNELVTSTTSFVPYQLNATFQRGSGNQIVIRQLKEGEYSAGGTVSLGHIVEDNVAVDDPVSYMASVFQGLLKARGITVGKAPVRGTTPDQAKEFMISGSRDLASILADLNRYSNNFIAGQLVYVLGELPDGHYSFKAGLDAISSEVKKVGISSEDLTLNDGSGLSRDNRITVSALTKIIASALSDSEIAPDFQASLSKFGTRGTLKRRSLGVDGEGGIWAKTGSLDGVSSIAGTIPLRVSDGAKGGKLGAFAIITNGAIAKAEASELEEDILRAVLQRGSD